MLVCTACPNTDQNSSISVADPTGDPKEDAENLEVLFENSNNIEVEILEKKLAFAEAYAEDGDYKGYKKFKVELDKLEKKLYKDFEKDNEAEMKDLKKRIEKAEEKLSKNRDNRYDEPTAAPDQPTPEMNIEDEIPEIEVD